MPCLCVFRGLSIAYKNLGYANLYNVPHTTPHGRTEWKESNYPHTFHPPLGLVEEV